MSSVELSTLQQLTVELTSLPSPSVELTSAVIGTVELVDPDTMLVVEVAAIALGDGLDALAAVSLERADRIAADLALQAEIDAWSPGLIVLPHNQPFPPGGTPIGTVTYQRTT